MKQVLCLAAVACCLGLGVEAAHAQLRQCITDLEKLGTTATAAHDRSSDLLSMENGLATRQEEYVRC